MSDEAEADAQLQFDLAEADASEDTSQEAVSGFSTNQADDSNPDEIKHAMDRYTELEKKKNPGGALVVLAVLVIGGSLFIGITAGLSEMSGGGGGGDEGLELCFGGLIFAGFLGTVGLLQAGAHEAKLKKAFKDVSDSVNYNEKEDKDAKIHLKISLALIGGGWLLAQPWARENTIQSLEYVGIVFFLLGLVWLMFFLVADATNSSEKKKRKILAAARSQLKSEEDP